MPFLSNNDIAECRRKYYKNLSDKKLLKENKQINKKATDGVKKLSFFKILETPAFKAGASVLYVFFLNCDESGLTYHEVRKFFMKI